jgi:integrase
MLRLNEANVAKLKPRATTFIEYDTVVRGLGVRVTPNGARAFILTYRLRRQPQRRLTIGRVEDWTVSDARVKAQEMLAGVGRGEDPLVEQQKELEAQRRWHDAPTMSDLIDRYIEEHLPTKRPRSQIEDRTMIKLYILPALGKVKVTDVHHAEIATLHRKITKAGKAARANAVRRLLSKMFALAMLWHLRTDNPCRGVKANIETPRERYLSPEEIERLMQALNCLEDRESADVIMLALLTGARRDEIVKASWSQFDLRIGVWVKPSSHTKQRRTHRVPLGPRALELLRTIKSEASKGETMVFPTRASLGIRTAWERAREDAGLPDVRFHDLRHSFASLLVSDGVSLQVIGGLLGHPMRYSHLADDALREATERCR